MDKIAYNKCYIYRDKKYTWGIPDELADEFEEFFESMVVNGTVERLQNSKKKTPAYTPLNKKSHSKSSSVKSVNKGTGKTKRSVSLEIVESSDENSMHSIVIL